MVAKAQKLFITCNFHYPNNFYDRIQTKYNIEARLFTFQYTELWKECAGIVSPISSNSVFEIGML